MATSDTEARRMAADVDDLHNEGMATMASDIRDLHAEMRTSRRSMLRQVGVGGAAITLGSVFPPVSRLAPALAQVLTDGDIAGFAQSVELVAVAAYTMAAGSGKLQPAVRDVGVMFARHHQAHADAFGGAAGAKASNKPNAALQAALGPDLAEAIAGGQQPILEFAITVEDAAAATYLFALGALTSPAALKLTASILPVESQHAVVLGIAVGKSGRDLFPKGGANNAFQTEEGALKPDQFPVS